MFDMVHLYMYVELVVGHVDVFEPKTKHEDTHPIHSPSYDQPKLNGQTSKTLASAQPHAVTSHR